MLSLYSYGHPYVETRDDTVGQRLCIQDTKDQ